MATPTIDAMILGALHERPMSAYEMNKMMDQRGVRGWARKLTLRIPQPGTALQAGICGEHHRQRQRHA
ncbi:MAG: hypothetical protein ACFNUQ_06015 [Rothia dentocariosa]